MNFSKEQKEGIARVLDTLAVSALIGAVVGSTGHSPLSTAEIAFLFAGTPILLVFGYLLRSQK